MLASAEWAKQEFAENEIALATAKLVESKKNDFFVSKQKMQMIFELCPALRGHQDNK